MERKKLTPPINVLGLLQQYASVELLDIPVDIDGVCVGLKVPGQTPRVYVNTKGRSEKRIRFTLAHELGHIVVPWHTGLIVDQLEIANNNGNKDYWRLEAEANRFASELLMPYGWMQENFAINYLNPLDAVQYIYKQADVSYQAACIGLLRHLPPGYIYARLVDGVVLSAGRSQNTQHLPPMIGKALNIEHAFPGADNIWQGSVKDALYCWWLLGAGGPVGPSLSDQARSAFDNIVQEIQLIDTRIDKLWSSISGMIAFENGKIRIDRNFDEIYKACAARLYRNAQNNLVLLQFVEHPQFDEFLTLRIQALLERR